MTAPADDAPKPPRVRARDRAGRCYELAGRGALEHAGWGLVHGRVRGPLGAAIGHAWCRSSCGRWVYDATEDRVYAADSYAEKFAATEVMHYATSRQVAEAMRRAGHWGPWHDGKGPNDE